jgi:hypothetical protein
VKESDVARFWAKVSKRGPDECWPWTAFISPDGYGKFNYPGCQLAHRFSYELENGPIPDGLQVLHRCDNRPCVNPRHLFLGTLEINMEDRNEKGRQARGSSHASAILSEADIPVIRSALCAGAKSAHLAASFNVDPATIRDIKSGRTWRHVPAGGVP